MARDSHNKNTPRFSTLHFRVMGRVWGLLLLMAHRHMLLPHSADVITWVWKAQRTMQVESPSIAIFTRRCGLADGKKPAICYMLQSDQLVNSCTPSDLLGFYSDTPGKPGKMYYNDGMGIGYQQHDAVARQ